jgi:light-regulated signal transduction histidine kinase (bacteriophytochrome)
MTNIDSEEDLRTTITQLNCIIDEQKKEKDKLSSIVDSQRKEIQRLRHVIANREEEKDRKIEELGHRLKRALRTFERAMDLLSKSYYCENTISPYAQQYVSGLTLDQINFNRAIMEGYQRRLEAYNNTYRELQTYRF